MERLAQRDSLAALMTEDPFCAQEGVQTLQSRLHYERLTQIAGDLRLHLHRQALPYALTSDLLIRNVPLREGVSPDIALWPRAVVRPRVNYRSMVLTAEQCPVLVLEVVSESTVEADWTIKPEIYRLAGIGEYWLYDPEGYADGPPLQGWYLAGQVYVPIAGQSGRVADTPVVLYPSARLDTAWGLEQDTELRLRNPVTADWYRMTPETLDAGEARADRAETRADRERTRADRERTRADQAETRADQAEAENARLRALLQAQANR